MQLNGIKLFAAFKVDAAERDEEQVATLAQFKYLPTCSFSISVKTFKSKFVRVAAAAASTPKKDTNPLTDAAPEKCLLD